MKILITAMHYPVASARYMASAFERLGHTVRTAGPAMGNAMWGQAWDDKYTWIPNPPTKRWKPDFVLHMDGNWCPLDLQAFDCPKIVYGVDNHVRDYRFVAPEWDDLYTEWDHLFLAHGHGHRMDDDNVTWLPCGYDPTLHTPGLPYAERSIDVAMLAVPYGPRQSLTYAILEAIKPINFRYGLAIYEGYASTYQNAKISLVRSAAGDVAQRVFETAATGCLVVMDSCHDAGILGLIHDKNCLMYDNNERAIKHIANALREPEGAARVAAAGQAWALEHTWDARAQTIIEHMSREGAPDDD